MQSDIDFPFSRFHSAMHVGLEHLLYFGIYEFISKMGCNKLGCKGSAVSLLLRSRNQEQKETRGGEGGGGWSKFSRRDACRYTRQWHPGRGMAVGLYRGRAAP